MKLHRLLLVSATASILLAMAGIGSAQQESDSELHWYKGNTHTHTLNSDGDSPPGVVAHWYRDHDYDFLVISDHNFLPQVPVLQAEIDKENARNDRKPFLLVPGEEVTDSFRTGERGYSIHVNGIDTEKQVGKQGGESVRDVLQRCVDAIHDAGGLPHVNHPNFQWSLTADDIHSLHNLRHFEIFNGHPTVHNFGGSGHPSLEAMWDDLLSRGTLYYGVAVDDAHHFKDWGPDKANPGRGWIVVRAPELKADAIVDALNRGDFYASTGVELDEVDTRNQTLRLAIHQDRNFGYRTDFIGKDGKVLATDETLTPSYRLKAEDLYIRARITDSANRFAWTQPLFAEGALRNKGTEGKK